jgi:gamma-glutamylcyclotransferase (GGCT)/AIG2-like uncharacterized protein YtfP
VCARIRRRCSIKHLVFVYGTLKSGFHNHFLLEGSEFRGPASVQGKLYVAGLPYFKRAHGAITRGELYLVDDTTLERLDRLEGYREHNPETSFYNRVKVQYQHGHLPDDDTGGGEAWVYEYNGDLPENYFKSEGVYNG